MDPLKVLCAQAPDAQSAERHYAQLVRDPKNCRRIAALPARWQASLAHLLGFSDFLARFVCLHPETVELCGQPPTPQGARHCTDSPELRRFKYQELFKLCCLEFAGAFSCGQTLEALSNLADAILDRALQLVLEWDPSTASAMPCVLGLGKLGSQELNFSSDVDLIFLAPDMEGTEQECAACLQDAGYRLGLFSGLLEERTEDGFLYRVDLRLRPWGSAGPLLMTVDGMEQYYSISSDSWERLAWLRARPITGNKALGGELLERLQPFLFLRSLSTVDLERFARIKQDMAQQRVRSGAWDVKTGDGGIRDVEFFVQILQLLYGAHYADLRTPSILPALHGLISAGLLDAAEYPQIRDAYLFLRTVENRLQMHEERQLHRLSEDRELRMRLACSLLQGNQEGREQALAHFEERLERSQKIARDCFQRVLPGSLELPA